MGEWSREHRIHRSPLSPWLCSLGSGPTLVRTSSETRTFVASSTEPSRTPASRFSSRCDLVALAPDRPRSTWSGRSPGSHSSRSQAPRDSEWCGQAVVAVVHVNAPKGQADARDVVNHATRHVAPDTLHGRRLRRACRALACGHGRLLGASIRSEAADPVVGGPSTRQRQRRPRAGERRGARTRMPRTRPR